MKPFFRLRLTLWGVLLSLPLFSVGLTNSTPLVTSGNYIAKAAAPGLPRATVSGQPQTISRTEISTIPYLGWSATTSMTSPRAGHTATVLPNGKVLVAGGYSSPTSDALTSTELYAPATTTWTLAAPLLAGRVGSTATLLANGKVLIVGGAFANGLLSSAELYDPATNTWSFTSGNMQTARYAHTAVRLASGKVLIIGGAITNTLPYSNSAELYDPATDTWTTTGSMIKGRLRPAATVLPSGKVLVLGGESDNIGLVNNTELYDPDTGNWTLVAPPFQSYPSPTLTLLHNGKVLVVGAEDSPFTELYNPATGGWSVDRALTVARTGQSATLLPDGKVLVVGGYHGYQELDSSELYDPSTRSWALTYPLTNIQPGHTASLLPDGKVLIAGGAQSDHSPGGYTVVDTAELYDSAASCDPLVVINPGDDGSCGTLRPAVATAANGANPVSQTVTIRLAPNSNISLTNGLTLARGVSITTTAGCVSGYASFIGSILPVTITAAGNAVTNGTNIDGLTLSGNNSLYGLRIGGFSGVPLRALAGGGPNTLRCVKVSKSRF